jgi:MoaA/NifB/PqqE/SkfB family radical SAM enzyme
MNIQSTKKVLLELTSSCNLNCQHCFYRQNINFQSNNFLNKKKAFDLIDKFKNNNICNLVLTGGEPALHPNFIEIAKYAKKIFQELLSAQMD